MESTSITYADKTGVFFFWGGGRGGIKKSIRAAILLYEPRVIRSSLDVKVHSSPDEMSHNSLVFEIMGEVFGQPSPFQVVLKSELDLECGEFKLTESYD